MTAETNMYEAQIKEHKYEIDKLSRELQSIKKRYFAQKRKEQAAKEKGALTTDNGQRPGLQPNRQAGESGAVRFTGGGFNVTKTPA
ncbi:unnamed protein product [Protopolystoma xenopodis]|uniref:Uncharacterized protein n=1 Tax=Protopolystoma xenopodis TaxID=117903 RepID=A0A448WQY3_9PLAT|nr:unnamed protein product [Protopolystoma xenopodis]